MTLNLTVPMTMHTDFVPRITVIGVGGGGTNAVDNMIALNLQGVDFVVANTDAQQLQHSRADRRIQLGPHITQGLGAGAKPEIGRAAAEEAADELYRHLDNTHMVFITAGMGGGTGTGAAPVIARMARERNILTVGVVTKPFTFEGARRARAAEAGIEELQQYVDTLIVIPNQNLFRLANDKTGWGEAFKMADHVLYMGVRGVTDLMVTPGLVNLDFADIRAVMAEMGKAMMGTGEADGENRAVRASEAAISNPLLEDTSMAGARGLLINITGGEDMTLFEVDQAANRIREEVDEDANIIFGSAIDPALTGKIRVSVVATGIDSPAVVAAQQRPRLVAVGGGAPMLEQQEPSMEHAPQLPPMGQTGFTPAGYNPGQRMPQRQTGYGGEYGDVQPASFVQPQTTAQQNAILRQGQATRPQGYETQHQQAPAAPPATQAPARGLFAAEQQSPQQPQPRPPAPAPARNSLFGIVTGAFRRSAPEQPLMPPIAEHRQDPGFGGDQGRFTQDPRHEAPRAAVRPASPEEAALEIPAFLRRQSS